MGAGNCGAGILSFPAFASLTSLWTSARNFSFRLASVLAADGAEVVVALVFSGSVLPCAMTQTQHISAATIPHVTFVSFRDPPRRELSALQNAARFAMEIPDLMNNDDGYHDQDNARNDRNLRGLREIVALGHRKL